MNGFYARQMPLFVIWEETVVETWGIDILTWCTYWEGSRELLDIQLIKRG